MESVDLEGIESLDTVKAILPSAITTFDKFAQLALSDECWLALVSDILHNSKFIELQHCKHHRGMSRLDHCIHVSYSCYLYCKRHNLACTRIAARGGLLHDFFLYDYSACRGLRRHWLHGLFHPRFALLNAVGEFVLSGSERNVILRHMFPLTPIPPTNTASWLVVWFDKVWAMREYGLMPVHV